MSTTTANTTPTLTIVVPIYNERENLAALMDRLRPAIDRCAVTTEILFVDDGSTDGTGDLLQNLDTQQGAQIRILELSRNFGHQSALVAGLANARGQAVITLDGDLQHPPELIPDMVQRWRNGAEIVQTVRRSPADRTLFARAASRMFYRVLASLTQLDVPPGAADFRLMCREAVDAFLTCPERRRLNRGLVQWIGFKYDELPYDANARHAGRSKYSLRAKFRLAADAIFSFSSWPLRLAGLAGVFVSLGAAVYLIYVLWARLFTDDWERGWSSILATVLILGGMNLVVLWILGEYVGRLYEEAKQRPIYIIRKHWPAETSVDSRQH